MGFSKEQLLLEYTKCVRNTEYALRAYLQTYDNTQSKYVPLELFPDQAKLIKDYEEYNENIAKKYRQAGVSTVTAAWISKKLAFALKNKPEKVLCIANKLDTAVEFANKVRGFIDQWPSWVGITYSAEKNSQRHFKISNGCEVKAVATSKDALRGYTPTILIFDEAAYIEADSDFWAACMASLSTGGKVIVISTPNGYDPIYYEIYDQSIRGINDFKISEMFWWRDPRYTKDLQFIKVDDLIHFYLNRDEYPNPEIVDVSEKLPADRDYDEIQRLIDDGFKPTSNWFEKMVKKLKYDKRKVAQELECNFLGSGDNVFDSNLVQKILENDVKDPLNKMVSGGLWLWKEPIIGHRYIMGVDVSRGDSEDFSTFQIFDFDDKEQAVEYLGKLPPDNLADIVYKWATMYKAFVVVDITGGMGVSTARKLQELGYKELYVDGMDIANKWKFDPKMQDKIPGINFNNKRVQIIAALEEYFRHGLKIHSIRLVNEMNTFVYVNGRPDHMKGQHDDLIMSLAMAVYVADYSFAQLQKVSQQAKVLLESWEVKSYEQPVTSHFNPALPNTNYRENPAFRNQPSLNDYKEYSWLFGGGKR